MKFLWLLLVTFVTNATLAQTKSGSLSNSGGRFVGFNIDGDTRTGYTKIFPASTPFFHDDDWFKPIGYAGNGKGIIDVSDSASLRARLRNGENLSFTKRMIGQPYDISVYYPSGNPADGYTPQFLVDGAYFRDFYANDSSAFTSANKNGQNPNSWMGGFTNTGGKSDIIDVYTHVRTSGTNPAADSAWFFAGVSTKNVVGERYFDIEVYREPIYYNRSANGTGVNFVSEGVSFGHSRWELNAAGNVIRSGDIIISVAYKSGLPPEIDFRIWLAKSTYDSIQTGKLIPTRFKINGRWDLADDGQHGYAEIVENTAGELWGTGLGNYTGNASADSTFSTPWGTINTGGNWSAHYDQLQFVEIGLNFSRFGMNPFQYVTSFCKSPYAAIMVKSRSSNSFSANLDDFVGPVPFTIKNAVPFTVTPETLTCVKNTARLNWNFSARNYYRLIGPDGDTLSSNFDFRDSAATNRYLTVTKPGSYRVEATNFQGCPALAVQTIVVPIDTIPPTATATISSSLGYFYLRGGDTAASNVMTPFGRSSGLSWYWTGPNGFTSTVQYPALSGYEPSGMYHLRLTEARNGCIDRDSVYLNWTAMKALEENWILLSVRTLAQTNELSWQTPTKTVLRFEIERSADGVRFQKIGEHLGTAQTRRYLDAAAGVQSSFYRIKALFANQQPMYSNVVSMKKNLTGTKADAARHAASNTLHIKLHTPATADLAVTVVDMSGKVLASKNYGVGICGTINLDLPVLCRDQPVVVVVVEGGKLLLAKKL